MNNEIETIDGVKGEWRTVTKPSEVTIGQRVRYESEMGGTRYGYIKRQVIISSCKHNTAREDGLAGTGAFFCGLWANEQAFFPLPVRKEKRKVAKVRIYILGFDYKVCFSIGKQDVKSCLYQSRKSAIRGAKRFCKAIGYECEIVKEGGK